MGATGTDRGSYDPETVDGFGFEWSVYDQEGRDPESIQQSFDRYFASFPWDELESDALGLDVGCGSGRWSDRVRDRGYSVMGLDAAPDALAVASRRLPAGTLVNGSAVELPLADESIDFAFSLGVLHHLPDTDGALSEIHRVLRPGAPFLVYLYYAFDNRPTWFRTLWRASDTGRWAIARLPERIRLWVTRLIAAVVYWPFARLARLLERVGLDVDRVPLSGYRSQPFYVMQTDALDRFGTRLEKRYTRAQIVEMLTGAGFRDVEFKEGFPYWCATARA